MNPELYRSPMYVMYEAGAESFAVRNHDGHLTTYQASDYNVQVIVTPKAVDMPKAGWYAYADSNDCIEHFSDKEFAQFPNYVARVKRGEIYRVEVSGIRPAVSDDD